MPEKTSSNSGGGGAGPSLSAELTFDEMLRARQVFVLHTDEYISTPFDLRTILSELGQYPQDAELNFCVEAFGNKMNFNNFTSYLSFLKKRFMKPEPQDVDTLRAFVALGGGADRRGDINAENLRNACRHFDLTIDIDAMIREVDDDMSGKLEFSEFKSMWSGGAAEVPAAGQAPTGSVSESFSMDVDDSIMSGSLRSAAAKAAAAAAATAAAAQQKATEEEPPEADEDTIELLKQHLFPNAMKKNSAGGRKPKRTSLLTNQSNSRFGIPLAPTLRDANPASSAAGVLTKDGTGGDGSDSDDVGDSPQAYKGQYKPPSPVILSMRNARQPTKLRSGGRSGSTTPRRGKLSTKTTPRASPRR